jgi:hypothetical protein
LITEAIFDNIIDRKIASIAMMEFELLRSPPLSGTTRLGAVEEVAGGSLPTALSRFASKRRSCAGNRRRLNRGSEVHFE